MALNDVVLEWLKRYRVRSLVNAPCAGDDCGRLRNELGIEDILCVNIIPVNAAHVQADLCVWRPDRPFDAAYVNCLFCTSNGSPIGTKTDIAWNMSTWPVKRFIFYDTAIDIDWKEAFETNGWSVVERSTKCYEAPPTRCEVWEHAA